MDSIGALLVALVGAAVGAYFAMLKSRRERLWLDRYEVLRDVVVQLSVVESAFSVFYMEQLGVSAVGATERKRLSEEWPLAMNSMRYNVAKVRLYFKEEEIADFREAWLDLNSSFTDMYHGEAEDLPELHEIVSERSRRAAEEAIAIGQRRW